MTKRSRGVLNTRWSAIVSSTTPRFGPRCPPVWDRTLINSSRTSWASCGRSCSFSALMSTGDRTPSRNRVVFGGSEESDFVILGCSFFLHAWGGLLLCRWFEILHYRLAGIVASDDLDSLFRAGKAFLADFYQLHSFLVTHNQLFQHHFARFHLLDDLLETIH